MKPQKILCTVIFLLILSGDSYPAQGNDSRARNIYQLFTGVNPKLSESDAKNYAGIVIEAAEKFKQDSYVIAGIIVHESTVNNKAVSKGGDYGLMQVRWKVHEKAIKQRFPKVRRANDMFDARTNIFYGTEIFRDCMRKSDNDYQKAILRYSAGNTKLRDKLTATVSKLYARDNSAKAKATPPTPKSPAKNNPVSKEKASKHTQRSSAAEIIYMLQQETRLRLQEKKKEK